MTNFEAEEAERDVHLEAWYRDLMKVEEALTVAEQREARSKARFSASNDETYQRVMNPGQRGGGM